MNTLADLANGVRSREDFLKFLDGLARDCAQAGEKWENNDLRSYLEALSGYAQDIGGYYQNTGEVVDINAISWRMAAQMLCAATVYE